MDQMINDQNQLYARYGFPKPDHPTPLNDYMMGKRLNSLIGELVKTADAAGFYFNPASQNFQPAKQRMKDRDAEKILGGLVELTEVIFGTAYLLGFLGFKFDAEEMEYNTLFQQAWGWVYEANLRKRWVDGELVKPEGWEPPKFTDLVSGFYGHCENCKDALTREEYQKGQCNRPSCPSV